tara:strand:- start:467 stop:724 length:258 start_codon:yes stop_codon:yes gene_type:complete
MKKIVIVDNFAFIIAPNPDEDNTPWLYFQPISVNGVISSTSLVEYVSDLDTGDFLWRATDGGVWEEVDPRMGYDIDKIKEQLKDL